jgi:hypothetical protein
MKITKQQLKIIIQEELASIEEAPGHAAAAGDAEVKLGQLTGWANSMLSLFSHLNKKELMTGRGLDEVFMEVDRLRKLIRAQNPHHYGD